MSETLEALETASNLTYTDVLDAVNHADSDQRLHLSILADRISEALRETRNERGAV